MAYRTKCISNVKALHQQKQRLNNTNRILRPPPPKGKRKKERGISKYNCLLKAFEIMFFILEGEGTIDLRWDKIDNTIAIT